VANVAGERVAERLRKLCGSRAGARVELVATTTERFGVRCAYAEPVRLGVDRWVALLAARHAAPGAALLFTSGTDDGVAMGTLYGRPLFHASLTTAEYQRLLQAHGFAVSLHRVADPDCGEHTVWLARYRGASPSRSTDQ